MEGSVGARRARDVQKSTSPAPPPRHAGGVAEREEPTMSRARPSLAMPALSLALWAAAFLWMIARLG
jgi:hypothetical protein